MEIVYQKEHYKSVIVKAAGKEEAVKSKYRNAKTLPVQELDYFNTLEYFS